MYLFYFNSKQILGEIYSIEKRFSDSISGPLNSEEHVKNLECLLKRNNICYM